MSDMDEIKITQIAVIGILYDEGWFNLISLRELFEQFAVIPGDSTVFLE